MTTIRQAIQQMAEKKHEEPYALVCKVLEVNETARTCDVAPINEPEAKIFDVRLNVSADNTKGMSVIPEQDSLVLVTFMSKNTAAAFMFEKIKKVLVDSEEVIFNGGSLDGMVKVGALTQRLNALEQWAIATHAWAAAHIHGDPISGTTLPPAAPPTYQPPTVTTQQQIENPKIKQ